MRGDGFAVTHPELVAIVVQTAASDWAAARLAVAIERVAEALVSRSRRRALCRRTS